MTLPEILTSEHVNNAAALVRDYYTKVYRHDLPRTGSRFDNWAGGGDRSEIANEITADDLVAVSLLSIRFPATAAIGILETRSDDIAGLLEQIPTDRALHEVDAKDYEGFLGSDSPANKLWRLLRGTDTYRWGVGATTASKILARKRPHLIPIYDSVVAPLMGLESADGQWTRWHAALTGDRGLAERLHAIREQSEINLQISDLRIMDVVLWMHGKNLGMTVQDDAPSEQ
ncbi:DUF6308 family protein [Arthrobacter cavernae]|uniref:Uncharacterized protein n=1 Tax=Arthrobacter cavernae TaxID=2817681 RepID=A0A939HEW5_9MICC|nr:DUF6308 family protein [Arthrobacter cavernae]MBO1266636.1 hypothetical protein [Arthrobacter cavernae]